MKHVGLWMALGFLLGATERAGATITIFNTGVDATATPLPGGSWDPHYAVLDASLNPYQPSAVVLSAANLPFVWTPNTATAQWISITDAIFGNPIGDFNFRTTFTVPGAIPPGLTLSGLWTGDDGLKGVYLNGNQISGTTFPNGSWTILHPFSVSDSSGFFQSGLNTLDFKVDFADSRAEGVIVAGLTLTTPVVPEASNLAVGGLSGALVLGSLLRRRRRAAA